MFEGNAPETRVPTTFAGHLPPLPPFRVQTAARAGSVPAPLCHPSATAPQQVLGVYFGWRCCLYFDSLATEQRAWHFVALLCEATRENRSRRCQIEEGIKRVLGLGYH